LKFDLGALAFFRALKHALKTCPIISGSHEHGRRSDLALKVRVSHFFAQELMVPRFTPP
jgi:hypothetical protein